MRTSIAAKVQAFAPDGPEVKSLRENIPFYPWDEIAQPAKHKCIRTPLVLTCTPTPGKRLRIINVHTKSKYSTLKKPEQWLNREPEAIQDAFLARQKLSAEVHRLREYILQDLAAADGSDSILVLGNTNDGPFAELMEREFLSNNIVDERIGSFLNPDQFLKHAMTPAILRTATTVCFPDPLEGGRIVEELMEHLLVSPGIWMEADPFKLKARSCKVEKQACDASNEDAGPERKHGLRPSDHIAVSVIRE